MEAREPIRLLYWTREEFPTFRVDVDVLFGKELTGRGHQIDFVMQAAGADVPVGPQPWRGRTVYVGRTATGGFVAKLSKLWHGLWHDLTTLSRARRDRYDAIQFRDKFVVAAIGILVARARGLKYFFWLSFPYPEADFLHADTGETRFPFFARLRGHVSSWLLYKWILPRADHVFVQSERMKQDIMRKGIHGDVMTPVPMGIAKADLDSMPTALARSAPGQFTLGYLGVLSADRHLETLVEALAILRREGHLVRLLLVGGAYDAADRKALENLAESLGVAAHVEITGNLPREQALLRTLEMDVAFSPIFPSPIFLPASPTKLVEYLALRIPVVANDIPDQRAVLKASRAGVTTPWGVRHFARGARFLMRLGADARAAMGESGRGWVLEHRIYSHIADEVEAEYLRQLSRPARS